MLLVYTLVMICKYIYSIYLRPKCSYDILHIRHKKKKKKTKKKKKIFIKKKKKKKTKIKIINNNFFIY